MTNLEIERKTGRTEKKKRKRKEKEREQDRNKRDKEKQVNGYNMCIRNYGHHFIYHNGPKNLPLSLASASEVIGPRLHSFAGIFHCDASYRTI